MDAMRRQWLWELAFHIRRMRHVTNSKLRTYVKMA